MAHVTFFKEQKPSAKVQRALRKGARDRDEEREKAKARRRDKGCRFPRCGCRRLGLTLEVSHNEHKGAGGNPDGSRSAHDKLVQLCRERHQTNPFSIHKGSVECIPLTSKGTNGPVRWLVDMNYFDYRFTGKAQKPDRRMVEVAREVGVGVSWATPVGDVVLDVLAGMVL